MQPRETQDRVCPHCRVSPGSGIHCRSCGTNLLWRWRLPINDGEPERSPREPTESRFSPRAVEEKRLGPGQFRRGRLPLALTLDETLACNEDLVAVSRVRDDINPRWLAITSERVLLIDDAPITTMDGVSDEFSRSEISDLKAHPLVVNSRLTFRADGRRKSLKVFGRNSAREVLVRLTAGAT